MQTRHKLVTYPRPGPIGRLLRLLLGIFLLYTLGQFVPLLGLFASQTPPSGPGLWITAVVAFLAIPDLVNVAFDLNWRRWPQLVAGTFGSLAVLLDRILHMTFYGPIAGLLVGILVVWFLGYAGLSFVLQSIFATPGCEMRAAYHVLARIAGRETKPHSCSVGLTRLDQWEAERHHKLAARGQSFLRANGRS